ncbi:MAG: DUF5979 domain-containing protein [Pseudolysinimonas sp.]|uniref:DUF5979 domain-containing protein n=1 Tax=Pseudolysinimonas sp. TaxID=2680009 RepID=UPI003C742F86
MSSWGGTARRVVSRVALVAALAGLFGGVFAAAPALAAEDNGELLITKTIADDTLGPGDTLVYTITVNCLSFDCADAQLVDALPTEFDDLTLNPTVIVTAPPGGTSSYAWAGRTLTVDFAHAGGPGIAAGDGYSVQVRLTVPTSLSPDWAFNALAVENTATVSASNAVSVSASDSATVTIPYQVSTTTGATWSPPSTQFKVGEASTLTLRTRNTSNALADTLTLTLPTDPTAAANLFQRVDFASFGTVVFPQGADEVQVDAFNGTAWIGGAFAATPALPGGIAAADVRGLRITFRSALAGAQLVAGGTQGTIVLNLAQRATVRDGGASLVSGATVTATLSGTVSVPGQGTSTATGSATYTIAGLDSIVSGTLSFTSSRIAAGTSTGVAITGRNDSNGPLQSFTVTQPEGFLSADITFAGFRTSGSAWPTGATGAVITWYAVDDDGDPVPAPTTLSTPGSAFPNPTLATGQRLTGFSIEFTGSIPTAATAGAAFTIDVAEDAVAASPGSADFVNAARIDGTNDAGAATPVTPTATLTVLYPQVGVALTKTITPTAAVPAGGRSVVQLRGTTSSDSGYVSPSQIVLTDTLVGGSTDYWSAFDAAAIAPTQVPAGATLDVYSTTDGTAWTLVGTVTTSGSAQYYQVALTDPTIVGIRFVFTDADGGFSQGTTVQGNIAFVARAVLRGTSDPTAAGATPSDYLNTATVVATGDVVLPGTTDPVTASASATATGSIKDLAGGTGLMFDKTWVPVAGSTTVPTQSRLQRTVRLEWGTEVSGYTEAVLVDPSDPTQPVGSTVFQAFDLVRIPAISSSIDPLIAYDRITGIEISTAADGWVSIYSSACSPVSRCEGGFLGYTLTTQQREDALGIRVTFEEYAAARSGDPLAPPVGSGVASGPDTRRFDLVFEVRNRVRDASAMTDPTDPWVTADRSYNTVELGEVANTATLSLDAVSGSSSDTMLLLDPTPDLGLSKTVKTTSGSVISTPIAIPYPGDVAASGYPNVRFEMVASNDSVARAWHLRVTDQMPCTTATVETDCVEPSGGWTVNPYAGIDMAQYALTNPFEYFTIRDIDVVLSANSGIDPAVSVVTLLMADGTTQSMSLTAALGLNATALADVVGVSALYSGTSVDDGGSIVSGATATLRLDTRLRQYLRSAPSTLVAPATVVNSAFSQVWDGVLDDSGSAAYDSRSASVTLVDASLAVDVSKSFSQSSILEKDRASDVTVTLTANQSTSTASTTEVVVEDLDADFWNTFELRSFTSATLPSGANRVRVDVQLNGSSTWTLGTAVASSPALPAGITNSQVTALRAVFTKADGSLFSTTAPAAGWSATIRFVARLRAAHLDDSTPLAFPSTVTNTATASATHPWLGDRTDSFDRSITLDPGTFRVDVEKRTPEKETPAGITLDWQLVVTNTGTGYLDNPTVIDQLPVDAGLPSGGPLLFDPTSEITYATSTGGILPTTGVTMVYDSVARTLAFSWPDGSRLAPNEEYTITVPLQVAPGLAAAYGDVTNRMTFSSDRVLSACTNTSGNGEGVTSVGTDGCRTSNDLRTIAASAISSFKGVKGDVDDLGVSTSGAVNVSNAATACVADSQGYYRNPCAANSVIGGTDRWKLQFTNGGNVVATDATIVDVLPRTGDTYLGTGSSRGSTYRPAFAGEVSPLTDTTGGSTFTWEVTTTANPCPNYLTDSTCSAATWQSGPSFPTGSYPAVTAVRVNFDFPVGGMEPATTLALTYETVNLPTTSAGDGRAPVTAPLGTPRAWNSFGVFAEFGAGYEDRRVEPVRAGVQLASGPIQVVKQITGTSADYAPTSFAATASCEIEGVAVVLPSSGALTLSASAATPYTARIDGIPVGSVCEIAETTTGASSTSYSPAGASGASLSVAQAASSATAVPTAQVATITNSYGETSLTVTKAVSTTATVGEFGPFDFTLACTVDTGTATLTVPLDAADASFTLAGGASRTVSGIPVTARCDLREADSDGATTIGMRVGAGSTTTVAENQPYRVTLGTAAEYVVTAANTYASGRLSVTKDVTGASQYGDGVFDVAVECTYDGQTLFDGTFTLEDGDTELLASYFPVGTVCDVVETQAGGATAAAGDRSVTISAGTTNTVLTNRFDVGSLRIDKERTGAWERYGAGPFEAQVECTWDRPGESDLVIPLPDAGVVALTAGNGYTATVTGLIAGADCTVTETKDGAATRQAVSAPSPGTIPADGQSVVRIENDFATGSLRIDKVRDIAEGAEAFAVGPFEVLIECGIDRDGTWYELDLGDDATQTLSAPDYTVTVDDMLQGASCTVTETDAGLAITSEVSTDSGAVVIPAAADGPAVVTVTNHFLTGELDVEKTVDETLVQGGELLHYEISVENVGDVEAGGVTVTDDLDADLNLDASSIVATGWTCDVTGRDGDGYGGTLECVLDTTLPVGATAPLIAFTATLHPEVAQDAIANTAVVTSTTFVVAGDDDTVSTPVKWLDVDAFTECVQDAPWLDYSVDAHNLDVSGRTMQVNWLDADGDIVQTDEIDILADGTVAGRLLFPGAAVDADGDGIAWPGWRPALAGETPDWENLILDPALPSYGLRSGASVEFVINPTTTVAIAYPPATADCTETPEEQESELWMTKTASVNNLAAGGAFSYTMEIGNSGRGGVTGLILIDDIPEVLRVISVTAADPADAGGPGWVDCVVSDRLPNGYGGTITCELDRDLGSGERAPDVLLDVQLSPSAPGGPVVNTARVTAWELPTLGGIPVGGRGSLTTLALEDSAVVLTTLALTGTSSTLGWVLALTLLSLGGALVTVRRRPTIAGRQNP